MTPAGQKGSAVKLEEAAGRSGDRVTRREGFLDHLTLVVVQALQFENDAAACQGSALQDFVMLATTVGVIDGVTATDVLDGHSVPYLGT
jgi:hypothetical protein